MTRMRLLYVCVLVLTLLVHDAHCFSAPSPAAVTTGVRFSLFPKVHRDNENDPTVVTSLRNTVRAAVKDLDTLGVKVLNDAEMTSCLLAPSPTLFEAVRVAFGRASVGPGGLPRQVSMQCTFSAECLGDDDTDDDIPPRTVTASSGDNEFVPEAYILPARVACQFSVYPLGVSNHRDIIRQVKEHAKQEHKAVWRSGETPFCTALEGSGDNVLHALRSCFALARELSHEDVVMTATLTGNKRQWTEDFFARTCND